MATKSGYVPHPTQQAIAGRAYELIVERGSAHGDDLDDWFRAERELASPTRKAQRLTRELVDKPAS